MSAPPKTVDELLALHPWPREYASEPRMEWLWHYDVAASAKQLWPVLADTSRINRAMGAPEMTFAEREGVKYGLTRRAGMEQEWIEVPWNWVQGEWLTCTRLYTKGFAKVMHAIHRIEPISGGARVYLCVAGGVRVPPIMRGRGRRRRGGRRP